jgi:ABC-type branched-subunit amino acid transport system permease subunit
MMGLVSYLVFFTTIASILAIAVLGLNLQWGNTGLFNGGVVAFFGAGAYGTLLLGGTPQADHIVLPSSLDWRGSRSWDIGLGGWTAYATSTARLFGDCHLWCCSNL